MHESVRALVVRARDERRPAPTRPRQPGASEHMVEHDPAVERAKARLG